MVTLHLQEKVAKIGARDPEDEISCSFIAAKFFVEFIS